ncbi:MAG: flagellar motor protein MotB [Elusimicrobiota bacterium]
MRTKKTVFFGRRFGESAELDPNMWIVSYGDMMTNLMMFFLLLFALTQAYQKATQVSENMLIVKKLQQFGKVNVSIDRINVTLSQDIIFKPASAELKPEFVKILQELIPELQQIPGEIIVAGHADSKPLYGGKYKDNWFLSAARGWSVGSELLKNGLEPKRLQVRGYGEFNPVASNKTEQDRAKNRRIEICIMRIKKELPKRFIYYKTTGEENISEIVKKFLGTEEHTDKIRQLNPDKIDNSGKVVKDTELLIPYQP